MRERPSQNSTEAKCFLRESVTVKISLSYAEKQGSHVSKIEYCYQWTSFFPEISRNTIVRRQIVGFFQSSHGPDKLAWADLCYNIFFFLKSI